MPHLFRHPLVVFGLLAAFGLGLSLAFTGAHGFPLDDAWIHQVYARNLGQHGEFAFVPGQPSAGSTAPLWTLLLALGYATHLPYPAWTFLLGWACLTLTAGAAYHLALRLWPAQPRWAWVVGLSVGLEWHLIWAAASGMETLLFSLLVVVAFALPVEHAAWLGGLIGLSLFVRPDGLTLLPFVAARIWFAHPQRLRGLLFFALAFGAAFLPYLGFNWLLAGEIWPNTFYAKQAEYAIQREAPLWANFAKIALQPFIGAQALLLPALGLGLYRAVRARQWEWLFALGWVLSFLAAYALRLPVIYQHGRYLIPTIPVLLVLGVGSLSGGLAFNATALLPRLLSRAWALTLGLLTLAFVGIGAQAYAKDVKIIETEMVAAAQWLAAHTPNNAVIAAHDIGAVGYFVFDPAQPNQRQLLDLAGLVSPEVIPFIRDEDRLAAWLTTSHADYLMTFPNWYATLTDPVEPPIFQTTGTAAQEPEGTNMAVYRWR